MIDIFVTEKALQKMAVLHRWNDILKRCSVINVYSTNDNLIKYSSDEDSESDYDLEPVRQLTLDGDIKLEPAKEKIDEIKKNPSKVLEHPSGIYILDVSKKDAEQIQKEYGVICKNEDDIDDNELSDLREIISIEGETNHSWNEFLRKIHESPTNSIILCDRYIFSSDKNGTDNLNDIPGITNVVDIMNSILPDKFSKNAVYQILILYSHEPKANQTCKIEFHKLAKKIYKKISELRDYHIQIEFLSIPCSSNCYEKTHNRRVVTNYHILRVEHKLNAFISDKSICSQTMNWDMFFSKGLTEEDDSDVPYKNFKYLISSIRYINSYGTDNRETCMYQYACNGICARNKNNKIIFSPINNRLLK